MEESIKRKSENGFVESRPVFVPWIIEEASSEKYHKTLFYRHIFDHDRFLRRDTTEPAPKIRPR